MFFVFCTDTFADDGQPAEDAHVLNVHLSLKNRCRTRHEKAGENWREHSYLHIGTSSEKMKTWKKLHKWNGFATNRQRVEYRRLSPRTNQAWKTTRITEGPSGFTSTLTSDDFQSVVDVHFWRFVCSLYYWSLMRTSSVVYGTPCPWHVNADAVHEFSDPILWRIFARHLQIVCGYQCLIVRHIYLYALLP